MKKQEHCLTAVVTSFPETPDARLNRVEREQRRLRSALWQVIFSGGAIVLIVQVLLLSLFGRTQEGPIASESENNAEGRFQRLYAEQLWLRPKPGTPSLIQVDRNAIGRLVVRADQEDGPSLQFRDRRGTLRVEVTSSESDGPQITLFDNMQKTRARLTLTPDGHPSLTLCDEAERPRAVLTMEKEWPSLHLRDENLNPISRALLNTGRSSPP